MIVTSSILTMIAAVSLASGAAAAEDCASVHERVQFCIEADGWTQSKRPKINGLAVFRNRAGDAGKVIVEKVSGSLVTQKILENAILKSLLLTGPNRKMSMLIDHISSGKVDGLPAGNLKYKIPAGDENLRTVHSYLVADGLVLQFITMTPMETQEDAAQSLHQDFLGHFKITRAEQLL